MTSPVGIPIPPREHAIKRSEMKLGWKLFDTLWNNNVTPQSILRVMGPRGPKVARDIVRRRFQNRWNEEETELIGDYLYHITCATASGEYALNALLEPVIVSPNAPGKTGVYARAPLYDNLLNNTHKVKTLLQFGDHDWMYHPQISELVEKRNHLYQDDVLQLSVLPAAGHHLYLDNTPGFHNSTNQFCKE